MTCIKTCVLWAIFSLPYHSYVPSYLNELLLCACNHNVALGFVVFWPLCLYIGVFTGTPDRVNIVVSSYSIVGPKNESGEKVHGKTVSEQEAIK